MIGLTLYLVALVSPLSPSRCQELGPRLDGTFVTVCDGAVVRVRDQRGNSRQWNHATDTVIVRARGSAPMILGKDGR